MEKTVIKHFIIVILLCFVNQNQGFSQMPDTICELVKIEKVETLERHFVLCVKFSNSNLRAKIIKIRLFGQESKFEIDSEYRICMRNDNDLIINTNFNVCLMLDFHDETCLDGNYTRFFYFIKEIDEL